MLKLTLSIFLALPLYSQELNTCLENNLSTHEQLACTRTDHKKWDQKLNEQYNKLMKKLTPPEKENSSTQMDKVEIS